MWVMFLSTWGMPRGGAPKATCPGEEVPFSQGWTWNPNTKMCNFSLKKCLKEKYTIDHRGSIDEMWYHTKENLNTFVCLIF